MRHTIGAVRTTNEMAPTRRIKKRFMSIDVGFPDEDWSRRFVPQLPLTPFLASSQNSRPPFDGVAYNLCQPLFLASLLLAIKHLASYTLFFSGPFLIFFITRLSMTGPGLDAQIS